MKTQRRHISTLFRRNSPPCCRRECRPSVVLPVSLKTNGTHSFSGALMASRRDSCFLLRRLHICHLVDTSVLKHFNKTRCSHGGWKAEDCFHCQIISQFISQLMVWSVKCQGKKIQKVHHKSPEPNVTSSGCFCSTNNPKDKDIYRRRNHISEPGNEFSLIS